MVKHATQTEERIQQVEFRAMGSQIIAAVKSDVPEAGALLGEVSRWFAEWEQTLSRFKPDSELSRLNRSGNASEPIPVSDTLWTVLQLALQAAHYTDGLVTPTLLNALEAAGYDTSFDTMSHHDQTNREQTNRKPSNLSTFQRATQHEPNADWRHIETYPNTHSVRLPGGVRLDFGGIAKGWAADQAASRLAQYGPALVNAGGDIAVSGPPTKGHDWPIGIDAPALPVFAQDTPLELLAISLGGVATSGRDHRRWQQEGEWRHHIIDPRTGSPANTDVLAATVVAPTACTAEIGAKVCMLLGSAEGLEWLETQPSLAGLLALENGQVVQSKRLVNHLWRTRYGI